MNSTALATTSQNQAVALNEELLRPDFEKAQAYTAASKAPATLRAYASDWKHFSEWCETRGLPFLPASSQTVGLYLASHGDNLKPATLARRLSAIGKMHQTRGFESPATMKNAAVSEVVKGIRRTHGTVQNQKAPVMLDDLKAMLKHLPWSTNPLRAARDHALLLIGFSGAFRRSELVALTREDVTFSREGVVLRVVRSKTDQEGAGKDKALPYGSHVDTCPVRVLQAWIEKAGVVSGPIFRGINRHGQLSDEALTGDSVALLVKQYATAAGLDPKVYAGHSLRAGLVTEAAGRGVPDHVIMSMTLHTNPATLHKYKRSVDRWRENAASKIGL